MEITPGTIYLAKQRGYLESNALKRYCTFNFENYQNAQGQPVGSLYLFNDDVLVGGKLSFFLNKTDAYHLILALNGSLDVVQADETFTLNPQQIQLLNVGKGEVLEMSNPHQKDEINYLHFAIKTDVFIAKPGEKPINLGLQSQKNTLIDVVSSPKLPFKLCTGLFDAQAKATYKLQYKESNFFAFVIAGDFEIAGTRLHARDGLALLSCPEIEVEAITNHATIFLLEIFY